MWVLGPFAFQERGPTGQAPKARTRLKTNSSSARTRTKEIEKNWGKKALATDACHGSGDAPFPTGTGFFRTSFERLGAMDTI